MFGSDEAANRRTFLRSILASIILPVAHVISLLLATDRSNGLYFLWIEYMMLSGGFEQVENTLLMLVCAILAHFSLLLPLIEQTMQGWALVINGTQCIIRGGWRIACGWRRMRIAYADLYPEEFQSGLRDIRAGLLPIVAVCVNVITAEPDGKMPTWLRNLYLAVLQLSLLGMYLA